MMNLCEFLGVEEGEVFKITGDKNKYRVIENKAEILKDKVWSSDYVIDINIILKNGISKIPKKKFTKKTLDLFRKIPKKYEWIAKDKGGTVGIYGRTKPIKKRTTWSRQYFWHPLPIAYLDKELFKHIHWEDDEPIYIDDYVDRK